jgi:hypothetical protein
MGKIICKFCGESGVVSSSQHRNGCPEMMTAAAVKLQASMAWKRGYNDAISGVGEAESASDSYSLGYNVAQEDIEKVEIYFNSNLNCM